MTNFISVWKHRVDHRKLAVRPMSSFPFPDRARLAVCSSLLFFSLAAASLPSPLHAVVPVAPSCSSTSSCTSALNAAFAQCTQYSSCTIALEAGTYLLTAPVYSHLVIAYGPRNVVLLGAGVNATTLLCANLGTQFVLEGGSNITFSGFSIDNVRVPFTLATVVSASASTSSLTFDQAAYPIDLATYPWLGQAQAIIGYDVAADRFAPDIDEYFLSNPVAVKYVGQGEMVLATKLDVNATVVIRHQVYGYNSFEAFNSGPIAFTEVNLYSTGGMGILTQNVVSIALDGFRILKKAGRPMSITADGLHAINTRGGSITVRNCIFEGQGDDGINVPTVYTDIESISADRLNITVGKNGGIGDNDVFFQAGTHVNFFNRSSLLPLGVGQIATFDQSGKGSLTLVAPLPAGLSRFDLMNSADGYAGYVEVTDSVFRANRARGALLKSSNVYCARNTFDHCTEPGVKTETDGCNWFEGHPVTNWTVVDNAFIGCNYRGTTPGVVFIDNYVPKWSDGVPTMQCFPFIEEPIQHNLNISGNSFYLVAGDSAVYGYAAETISVSNNVVTRAANTSAPAAGDLVCIGCVNTEAVGNVCDGGPCKISGL